MKLVEEHIVQTAKLELYYGGFTVYMYSHRICTVFFYLCVHVVYLNIIVLMLENYNGSRGYPLN